MSLAPVNYKFGSSDEGSFLLDFSGFIEKSIVDYSFLFASKCPSLEGKDLCEYLVEMDKEEYKIVVVENKEFQNIDYSYRYLERAKITSIALGILFGIVSLYFLFRGNIGGSNLTEQQKDFAVIAQVITSVVGFILLLIGAGFNISKTKAVEDKVFTISQNRFLRMKDKLNNLFYQINQIGNRDDLIRDQLIKSRNYFHIKMAEVSKKEPSFTEGQNSYSYSFNDTYFVETPGAYVKRANIHLYE